MFSDYQPERRKKLRAVAACIRFKVIINMRLTGMALPLYEAPARSPDTLDRNDSAARDSVLQSGRQLVDIGGGNVYRYSFQHRHPAAADDVAPNLNQEGLDNVRVELLGR